MNIAVEPIYIRSINVTRRVYHLSNLPRLRERYL